ncbi:MAG: deoxyribonuclease IV [Candidatus Thermoplasmatota archaeon]|nr:deoxyribonuclease IV [Candidatus Thermoplasmatota archaeon]
MTSLLGAHVSIAGGVELAPGRGDDLGCEAIQIFSKNQRQWAAKPLTEEAAEAFKRAFSKSQQRTTAIHDSYLINLADRRAENVARSRDAFVVELERAQLLGVPHLIFHPGNHRGEGLKLGLRQIAASLDLTMKEADAPDVSVLLEGTAGAGNSVGSTFEQLQGVREAVDMPERVGFCFDTCHLFAAGYDIRTAESYELVMQHAENILGLENIQAFHLNDCKGELGSHLDRHEHIGQGGIGLEGFRLLVDDARWDGVPMYLETPGREKHFKENLKVLKGLRMS